MSEKDLELDPLAYDIKYATHSEADAVQPEVDRQLRRFSGCIEAFGLAALALVALQGPAVAQPPPGPPPPFVPVPVVVPPLPPQQAPSATP